MKKFLLSMAALVLLFSCENADTYTVKARISGDNEALTSGEAYMVNMDRNDRIADTAKIVNGVFEFKGSVKTPEMYSITVPGLPGRLMIFLENSRFTITGTDQDFSASRIEGGVAQQMLNRYVALNNELMEQYNLDKLMQDFNKPETTEQQKEEIMKTFENYQAEAQKKTDELVSEDPVSHFALYLLQGKASSLSVEELEKNVAPFSQNPAFEGNKIVEALKAVVKIEKGLQVGKKAPDFTLNDTEGEAHTLSAIYPGNKVTMIDFWAGWCGPCRRFNPELVKIYKKFHRKGFGIVGVSLDSDKDNWLKAIKTDKLDWLQLSSLKSWQCPVAQQYHVQFIPQNVFVDAEGNILARQLPESEIVPFLEKHLK